MPTGNFARAILRKLRSQIPGLAAGSTDLQPAELTSVAGGAPHFVTDYESYVDKLLSNYSRDEAMSHAVGGDYEETGLQERAILEYAGLKAGMKLVDVGCGSGRLASALAGMTLDYLGTDVVQKLLDYAASKAPATFRFRRHTELSVPVPSASLDMVCAFSVFTHLQQTESFLYLTDFARALKPGGLAVISFLEFGTQFHWQIFADTVEKYRTKTMPHLNMFIERNVIKVWCEHLGLELLEIVEGADAPWGGKPLGQCTAILRVPNGRHFK